MIYSLLHYWCIPSNPYSCTWSMFIDFPNITCPRRRVNNYVVWMLLLWTFSNMAMLPMLHVWIINLIQEWMTVHLLKLRGAKEIINTEDIGTIWKYSYQFSQSCWLESIDFDIINDHLDSSTSVILLVHVMLNDTISLLTSYNATGECCSPNTQKFQQLLLNNVLAAILWTYLIQFFHYGEFINRVYIYKLSNRTPCKTILIFIAISVFNLNFSNYFIFIPLDFVNHTILICAT